MVKNIENKSRSESFDEYDFNLLKNGLNFVIPDSRKVLEVVIAHIEIAIQHLPKQKSILTKKKLN